MDTTDYGSGIPCVHSILDRACERYAEAPAVRDDDGVWTYADVARRSHAMAHWLTERGVRRGDRVVVQMETQRDLVALFMAVSRVGAIFVPLNTAMKAFHQQAVLRDAEPVIVVGGGELTAALAELASVPVYDHTEIAGDEAPYATPENVVSTDIAVIVYTSGSTSLPKGVVEPHEQVVFATYSLGAALGYRPDDVVFCRFPISWDYGLYKVLLAFAAGCEIVLAPAGADLTLLKRIAETGTTVLPLVPSLAGMLTTLARRQPGFTAPVRLISNTGAALPEATIAALREVFPGAKVVRQFGQTECKRITVMPPAEDTERPGCVGLPMPGTEVRIAGPDGESLPAGEVGEIVARGKHVMAGYWRNPELSAKTFQIDPDGTPILRTGDYGWMDADGYLYFEGRRDDMFKRKGIRVSALEIEAAAMDVPGVENACVVPPGDRHDLGICVVTELEEKDVIRELRLRLEPAKVPAICRRVDAIPLTTHGKHAVDQLRPLLIGA